MAKTTLLRRGLLALVAVGMLMCALGELSAAFAQEGSSRRVRQYRRPWRSGVVSFGLQGQYGYNAGGTDFTDPFDWGPGLTVSARYVANKWASIGVRFEVHNFDASEDSVLASNIGARISEDEDELIGIDSQRITTAGLDMYVYFNRTKETMYYFNGGTGIYQLAILLPADPADPLKSQSARIEKDNVYIMGGVGLEHFLRRTITFDLNGKVFAYLGGEDGVPVSIQVAAGLQFYFFD
jgi:hypothetical protein